MEKTVSVLLVGISGYGELYLKELLNKNESVHLAGVVDIHPERSDYHRTLLNREIPIYDSIEAFYVEQQADLAVIATPIHLHTEQSCYCMNHGSHVLCEKPMTSNPKDIEVLTNTRDKTRKFLAIGFNWSFAPSTLELKADILEGKFGKPIRFKSMVQWPRNEAYYHRSSWAGKKYSPDGSMIFDSVANNATAHFLHHLLYLTGDHIDTSAQLDAVTAELYRVNHIETFDTCAVQIKTTDDVDLFFYASHATKETSNPRFQLEFEKATLTYNSNEHAKNVVAVWKDGSQKVYEDPEQSHLSKLPVCIHAIQTGNHKIPCGPEAASTHVKTIQAMHESVPDIKVFPDQLIHFDADEKKYWIDGLEDDLFRCYSNWRLPSDLEFDWSVPGKEIKVSK